MGLARTQRVGSGVEDERRATERAKYTWAYAHQERYRLKGARLVATQRELYKLPMRGSYLDVSCGRGETLDYMTSLGHQPVCGTEIVPELVDGVRVVEAWVHDLPFPDNSFDTVSLLDVLEHLAVGDDELACRELARVARRYILITANNHSSFNHRGDDLHINKRTYDEWDGLLRSWLAPHRIVVRRPLWNGRRTSEFWRVHCESP